MTMRPALALALALLLLGGCTGPVEYRRQASATDMGYREQRIADGVWRVRFQAGGGVNWNSLRSFWLQRAAEVALEQGHDGFELLTEVSLSEAPGVAQVQVAAVAIIPVFIPNVSRPQTAPALLEGDIRLLRAPVHTVPFKVFDARRLRAALVPHMQNRTCNGGNVCPHATDYISRP